MAYAASFTVTEARTGLALDDATAADFVLTITETEAATTSEATITLAGLNIPLPSKGRILARISKITAGTATTLSPVVGDTTAPATAAAWRFAYGGTPALTLHEQPAEPLYYSLSTLYHRSVPNAGADNSITTVYYISAGWDA